MFWKVEGRTGLYVFFKTVCDVYGLIPEDNYTIPAEAEGIEPPIESRSSIPPLILKREPSEPGPHGSDNSTILEGVADHTLSTAGTTKRHRHSPSVGATSVHTVVEENEDEDEQPKDHARPMSQIFEPVAEDSDVPAIGESEEANDVEAAQAVQATQAADEPESAAPEATIAQPEKQESSEEKSMDAEPLETEEEKQAQVPVTEEATPEVSETPASDTKTEETEAPKLEIPAEEKDETPATEEAEKEEETPVTKEAEKAENPKAPAEPVDKAEEDTKAGE